LGLLVEPLLVARPVLREQIGILHHRLQTVVRDDEVCQRLMTVPGVRPLVALTYGAAVDVAARFRKSSWGGVRTDVVQGPIRWRETDLVPYRAAGMR